jgi:flavorubredoxin
MKAHKISESVLCLHADIEAPDLFEGIWPIPQGVSLNAYIVRGEKIALIDLIRDWGGAPRQLEDCMNDAGVRFDQIDYLVLNHLEPDHTGWLRDFRQKSPKAEIIATARGINLVKSFYKIEDGLRAVKDGETLDLGKGKVLVFRETPNIHWPETMVTWDSDSGTLFTCDAFGSYRTLGDRVFDDEFTQAEHALFEQESLRYYANIVASFSGFVEKAAAKVADLDIRCVAPSHGIVWRRDPRAIIARYLKYASYAKGGAEREIAVIWGSMYGNTKQGVDAVIRGIEAEGVPYTVHRVPDENVSWVLMDAYRSAGLVIAMPTYEYAMFPPMANVLDIFRRKHLTGKTALRIGSWGWVGGAKKDYEAAIEPLKWNSLESREWTGAPDEAMLQELEAQGRELARVIRSL